MALQAEPELDDESLMALIRKGDHQAFVHLVRRHTDRFYRLAWRMTSDETEAEDLVQEAFLKLWRKPSLYKPRHATKFTTWFYRVVTNLCLDHLRKNQRQQTQAVDNPEGFADERARADKTLEDKRQKSCLEIAIATLPEKQKAALNLCFYEGLSNKEAALIIGVRVKALESLLMRAKAGVKDRLIRDGIGEV